MPWWGWIIFGAVFLTAEVLIGTDFYLVFIGVGAVIVGILGMAGVTLPVWGQWLTFAGFSAVSLVVFRGRLKSILAKSSREFPTHDLVGAEIVVTSVGEGGAGTELRGSSWKVRAEGGAALAPGDRCVVSRVEGVTLVVRRAS